MPLADLGDCRIHYRLDGPADAPVVMLSNSLGTNFSMWDGQITPLKGRFRVLRYDARGHGQSSVPAGPYAMEMLGRDVIRLLDVLQIERVLFCGLSVGGMIGIWLGLHAAPRLNALVLCNTAARIGTVESWNARIEMVQKQGMRSIAEAVLARWFTPEFSQNRPEAVERTRQMLLETPPDGYAGCCAALRDSDFQNCLPAIETRTLVIAGSRDVVVTSADAGFLVERLRSAQLAELEAAHLSNIEAAEQFNRVIVHFAAA